MQSAVVRCRRQGSKGAERSGKALSYLADVALDQHREHQVAVALVGGVGHAVLEGARRLQHELGRALQALGRRELERDPRAVRHLGDVAAVLGVQLEPDPLRLVGVGAIGVGMEQQGGRSPRLRRLQSQGATSWGQGQRKAGLGAHTFLIPHDAATPASPLAAIARCPYAHSSPTAPSAPLYSPTRSSCAPPSCCTLPLISISAAIRSYPAAAPCLPRADSKAAP